MSRLPRTVPGWLLSIPLVYQAAQKFVYPWGGPDVVAQTSLGWGETIPGIAVSTTLEIPYSTAGGQEVNADSARAWGRDLARGLRAYLQEEAP